MSPELVAAEQLSDCHALHSGCMPKEIDLWRKMFMLRNKGYETERSVFKMEHFVLKNGTAYFTLMEM